MSILVNENSRIVVQGFTGREGTFHARQCLDYGTNIVAGITPGKGGQQQLGKPVFNTVKEAVNRTQADVSLIFVPPVFACDAIMEAASAGIKIIVCITEGIPVADLIVAKRYVSRNGSLLIGPNCPGIISAGKTKVGIMPAEIFQQGRVGIISKSGTLTYEAANQVIQKSLGISTAIGIGGDRVIGTDFVTILRLFQQDKETDAVVLIGEIGGELEFKAAQYIKNEFSKPVVAFIAGQTAPAGKRMGHAGAIIAGSKNTAEEKIKALADAGAVVCHYAAEIGLKVKSVLDGSKRK